MYFFEDHTNLVVGKPPTLNNFKAAAGSVLIRIAAIKVYSQNALM